MVKIKRVINHYIKLLHSKEYKKFRKEVRNFRKKWLKINDANNEIDPKYRPPINFKESDIEYIWQDELLGYDKYGDIKKLMKEWQEVTRKELNIHLMKKDIKEENTNNFDKYKNIIAYEKNKDKNKKESIFKYLKLLKKPNYNFNKDENLKMNKYLKMLKNHDVDIIHLEKLINWYDKIKYNVSYSKDDEKLEKKEKIKYDILKDSFGYTKSDYKSILNIIRGTNNVNSMDERYIIKKNIYKEIFTYENLFYNRMIVGYRVDGVDIDFNVNEYNVPEDLWLTFQNIFDRWNIERYRFRALFNEDLLSNNKINFKEAQSFYSFLNCCIFFKMDTIDNLKNLTYNIEVGFNQIENKKLYNIKNILIKSKLKEFELDKIKTLLKNKDLDKSDIRNYLDSEEFQNEINNLHKKFNDLFTEIWVWPDKLPKTQKEWKKIYKKAEDHLDKKEGDNSGKNIIVDNLLRNFQWYIKALNGKTATTISKEFYSKEKHLDKDRRKVRENIKGFCNRFNIENPLNSKK